MKNIILASASPRRSEILENLRIPFTKRVSTIDEQAFVLSDPIETVKQLAYEKVKSVIQSNTEDFIIIGADTIVVYDNKILGKPQNSEEAFKYLKLLSGKKHSVFSGIAMIWPALEIEFISFCETSVFMRPYNDLEIEAYIRTKEPLDKAGAYGIQGYGAALVDKIDGDYYNVVGLPISKLIEGFHTLGVDYFDSYHD